VRGPGLAVQDGEGGSELVRHVMSDVGHADDGVLLSSSLKNLSILLHLIGKYCEKFQVKLVGSKTKLLSFNTMVADDQAAVEVLPPPSLSIPPPMMSMLGFSWLQPTVPISWTESGRLCLLSCMEDQPGGIEPTRQLH
jgi:hypothetical protein